MTRPSAPPLDEVLGSAELEMADWITEFVPEVPVRLITAGEPFWAPK